ncbi:protein kinase [Rhodococcus koreensis]|uniref:protein kinase domain-containing protein n=1 Tax=Rhodococcus koreensis TaxID=99653 RepID=UPI003671CEE3
MGELNSWATQRDVPAAVSAELSAAGFEDAQEIGRGGFGVVFRCLQRSLDRTVAVKVLTSTLDGENIERFLREQRAMGRLSGHPNIVNILQIGATRSGSPYIVMQYQPRDSLEVRIRRDGPLGWVDTLGLGVKLAGALETAHRLGVLHRDVKPANILLTEYGDPQLTDFGIAHMSGAFETMEGTVTGSPAFTAPEVLAGASPLPTSDVYSLGATLFCTLTGHAPFERREGEQVVAQFLRITTQPIPDLRGRDLPDDVCQVVEHAMARAPGERPATAEDFGDQLRAVQFRHNLRVDEMAILPTAGDVEHRTAESSWKGPAGPPTELSQMPSIAAPNAGKPTRMSGTNIPMSSGRRGKAGNLPLELTSFVGRRHELAETKKALSTSRLVTLTGMGGVGKTRLALRVATESRRAFKDGVWLVELGELRDAMLVASSVSLAFGLRNHSADPPLTMLTDYLLDRRLLLVLDNCEHLVVAAAILAEKLLRTCPGLRILATSREPLGVGGEAAIRVPPMSVPDMDRASSSRGVYESVTLFTERAVTAVPDFEITEANRAAVAQICQRLDGLPLPIELAAVRLRAMSAQQILDRLTDRYRLLTVGSRIAPSRQQTLRLCIDWSYELCTPQEQRLWARLAVFAGSFELDAAEVICAGDGPPADLFDVVASLVDKSILIREEPGAVVRYRLLDTLREYGWEKLHTVGEDDVLRRRHRDCYAQLGLQAEAEWVSPHQRDWITRLERETPNLRDALRFCVDEADEAETGLRIAAALFPFWTARGHLTEGRLWFDRVLDARSGDPTAGQAKALYLASVLACMQGDLPVGTTLLAEAEEISDRVPNTSLAAIAEYAAASIALYNADPSRAVECFEAAVRAPWSDGYLFCQIGSLLGLGLAYMFQNNPAQALLCHQKLLAVAEEHGELIYRGRSSMVEGWALWQAGEPGPATRALEQGLRQSTCADDPVGIARCLQTLAWIEADQKQERAAVLLGAAHGLWREIGGPTASFLDKLGCHADCVRRTRRTLGERKFEEQFQYGRGLRFEEAAAYALGNRPSAPQAQTPDTASLTRRERQVAELIAKGLTNKAIAEQLVISPRTAQGHVEHILAKLGFISRTQVAAWVVDQSREPKY